MTYLGNADSSNRQLLLLAWRATVHWVAESDMTEGLSTRAQIYIWVMKGVKTAPRYLDYITGCSGTVNQYREKWRRSKFY